MKKKQTGKRLLAAILGASMLAASTITAGAAVPTSNTFIQKMDERFQDPGIEYRPEARWWLAEGSHTDETIRESIKELYDSGFGAVEFLTLDESAYLDDARYAWGSEEWTHDSHLIMEECNKYGMGVSFTSGTHWSTANLAHITPDDQSASQELGYATIDLTAGQTYSGALPVPELSEDATKMRLERVVIAEKTTVSEDGKITSLNESSLEDITEYAEQVDGEWTINYTAPEKGENYTLFAFWQYGTSESYRPSVTGKSYTINYLSREGIDTLIEYWDKHVLDDSMKEMIRENGDVSMYMDSLELGTHGPNSTGNIWCEDYLEEFKTRRGYDISKYLPVLILQSNVSYTAVANYKFTIDGNDDLSAKLRNDIYQTNTELYMEECLDIFREWLHSFGLTLRAETAYGAGVPLCASQSVKSVDYIEGESLEFGTELEMYRLQTGAAHLYDKTYSSETGALYYSNYWNDNNFFRQTFYTQFASGVQRTVVHGYSSEYGPEQNVNWPGYEGMQVEFSERFNKRQPNSIDYPELTTHIARVQKALRQGTVQIDLGILRSDYNINHVHGFSVDTSNNKLRQHEGIYWQDTTLQDAGYTYDYFSPYLLQDSDITCENGLVQADGVAYQALALFQEELPYESAEVLYQWAQQGLPVVIIDGPTTEQIRGKVKENDAAAITTGQNDGKDGQLAELMTKIKALGNVSTVQTQAQAYDALINLGVRPRAEYNNPKQQNLLSVLRKDDDASYLYVYNYMYEDAENYVGQISLEGLYQPYVLDTWSGETTQIAEYSYSGDRTILNIDLAPGDIIVFALDPNVQNTISVIDKSNVDQVTIENGSTILYVPESGISTVTYSDGTTHKTSEASVPEDITLDNWNLTVQDWQPGEKIIRTEDRGLGYTTSEATYATNKVDVNVGQTALVPWKEIPNVGEGVSGVGIYTTSFTLPETWDTATNVLRFKADSFGGGTAAIFVNGERVAVNMDNQTADLSKAVKAGENTIEVRVTSSLRNRIKEQGGSNIFWTIKRNPQSDDYGLIGNVILETYSTVAVVDQNANKTILQAVLAYAETAYASDEFNSVIASVQASFTAALENARAVKEDLKADQTSVDAAWQALMTEIHKLGFIRGDKTSLGELIDLAETFNAEIDSYTPVTAVPFTTTLIQAKAVYEDGDAMQGDVAETESKLLDAMMNLRYRADKSVLESILSKASEQLSQQKVLRFSTQPIRQQKRSRTTPMQRRFKSMTQSST